MSLFKGIIVKQVKWSDIFGLFMIGGVLLFGDLSPIVELALIDLDGTIIKEQHWGRHKNYHCIYTIELNNANKDKVQYRNYYLENELPAGTKIEKKKWELDYKINGQVVKYSFPSGDLTIFGYVGLFLIIAGIIYLAYLLFLRLFCSDN